VLEPRDRRRADSPGSPAAAPAARLHARAAPADQSSSCTPPADEAGQTAAAPPAPRPLAAPIPRHPPHRHPSRRRPPATAHDPRPAHHRRRQQRHCPATADDPRPHGHRRQRRHRTRHRRPFLCCEPGPVGALPPAHGRRTHHRHRASAGPVQPDRRQRATSVAGRAKVRLTIRSQRDAECPMWTVVAFGSRRPWVRRVRGRCPGVGPSGFGAAWAWSDQAEPNRRSSIRRAESG